MYPMFSQLEGQPGNSSSVKIKDYNVMRMALARRDLEEIYSEKFELCLPQKEITIAERVMNVQSGASIEILVTHVEDPEHFHCQETENSNMFSDMMIKIHNYYSNLKESEDVLQLVSVGQPCIAQYAVDQGWYRAKIKRELSDGSVEVLFVDFGNREIFTTCMLKVAKPEFMKMPAQAIPCCLRGITSSQGFWSPEHIAKFEDMVLDKVFQTKFILFKEDSAIHVVELYSSKNICVNTEFGNLIKTVCGKEQDNSFSRCVTINQSDLNLRITLEKSRLSKNLGKQTSDYEYNDTWTMPCFDGYTGSGHASSVHGSSKHACLMKEAQNIQSLSCAGFPSLDFPVGKHLDLCMVLLVSPYHFWSQPFSMASKLKSLMADLNSGHSSKNKDIGLQEPTVGSVCLAKFSEDGLWYRGQITNVLSSQISVLFIDYGNEEILLLSDVRVLPSKYLKVPALAVKCSLNITVDWKDEQIDRFQELALDKRLSATILAKKEDGTYIVDLYDPYSKKNISSLVSPRMTTGTSPGMVYTQLCVPFTHVMDVYISWVTSPQDFWVQLAENEVPLQEMVQEIQDTYNSVANEVISDVVVGQSVIAKFSHDEAWYRAIVEEVMPSQVKVHFVDYGNDDIVPTTSLRKLVVDFVQLPCQAIRCCLSGVSALPKKTWDEQAKEYLKELMGSIATCVFIDDDKEFHFVELTVDGELVAENLISAGLAVKPACAKAMPDKQLLTYSEFPVSFDQIEEVIVTFIEDGVSRFWCQIASFGEELDQVMERLAAECESAAPLIPGELQVDASCCAKYNVDEAWYRAAVTALAGNSYWVHFVDYGNTEEVVSSNIHHINESATSIPKLALPCLLKGASATPEINKSFKELVLEKEVQAVFKSWKGNSYEVELFQKDGKAVSRELKNLNLHSTVQSGKQQIFTSILPNMDHPVGSVKYGYVSFVENPSNFAIQLANDERALENFSLDLSSEYSQDIWNNITFDKIELEVVCCAKFTEDETWYRARICDIHSQSVTVEFIDYGNWEEITCDQLKPLLKRFMDFRPFSLKCRLSNVFPIGSEWTEEDVSQFEGHVVDQLLTVKFLDGNEVSLSGQCGDVAERLVHDGYARRESISNNSQMLDIANDDGIHKEIDYYAEYISDDGDNDHEHGSTETLEIPTSWHVSFSYENIFPSQNVPAKSKCHVCHVCKLKSSVGLFYLQLDAQLEQLSELSKLMCELTGKDKLEDIKKYMPCCALMEDGKVCVRGVVTKIDSSCSVDLKAIDLGRPFSSVHQENLRKLDAYMLQIPPFAYPCILDGCPIWNEQNRSCFELLTAEKSFTVSFKSVTKPYRVELWDEKEQCLSDFITGKMRAKETPKSKCLHALDVMLHEKFKVNLCHVVSPGEFWCQPKESSENLKSLKAELEERYGNQTQSAESSKLCLYSLCVVRCTQNGTFYRGRIQGLKTFGCDVQFVDYGYTKIVEKKNIWLIQDKFLDLPMQAIECRLARVQGEGGCWSDAALKMFQKLSLAKSVTAEVIDIVRTPNGVGYIVDLLIGNVVFSQYMVDSGVAEWTLKPTVNEISASLVKISDDDETIRNGRLISPKVIHISVGQRTMLRVQQVDNPGNFWAAVVNPSSSFGQFERELTVYYNSIPKDKLLLQDPEPNRLCAACWSSSIWYRARIDQIKDDGNTVLVYAVDFGTLVEINLTALRQILPCFLSFPAQAIVCSLAGVCPKEQCWLEEHHSHYEKCMLHKTFQALVLDVNASGSYTVHLINRGRPLLVHLCDLNVARECSSSAADVFGVCLSSPVQGFWEADLKKADCIDVCVSYVNSPGDFWCRLTNSAVLDLLDSLEQLYIDIDDERDTLTKEDLVCGMPCVARCTKDGAFCRAEILSVETDRMAVVRFVDYGNEQKVGVSELKECLPFVMEFSKQAFHCILAGIFPKGGHWGISACSRFDKLTYQKTLQAKIVEVISTSNTHAVVLEDEQLLSLNETLVNSGYAVEQQLSLGFPERDVAICSDASKYSQVLEDATFTSDHAGEYKTDVNSGYAVEQQLSLGFPEREDVAICFDASKYSQVLEDATFTSDHAGEYKTDVLASQEPDRSVAMEHFCVGEAAYQSEERLTPEGTEADEMFTQENVHTKVKEKSYMDKSQKDSRSQSEKYETQEFGRGKVNFKEINKYSASTLSVENGEVEKLGTSGPKDVRPDVLEISTGADGVYESLEQGETDNWKSESVHENRQTYCEGRLVEKQLNDLVTWTDSFSEREKYISGAVECHSKELDILHLDSEYGTEKESVINKVSNQIDLCGVPQLDLKYATEKEYIIDDVKEEVDSQSGSNIGSEHVKEKCISDEIGDEYDIPQMFSQDEFVSKVGNVNTQALDTMACLSYVEEYKSKEVSKEEIDRIGEISGSEKSFAEEYSEQNASDLTEDESSFLSEEENEPLESKEESMCTSLDDHEYLEIMEDSTNDIKTSVHQCTFESSPNKGGAGLHEAMSAEHLRQEILSFSEEIEKVLDEKKVVNFTMKDEKSQTHGDCEIWHVPTEGVELLEKSQESDEFNTSIDASRCGMEQNSEWLQHGEQSGEVVHIENTGFLSSLCESEDTKLPTKSFRFSEEINPTCGKHKTSLHKNIQIVYSCPAIFLDSCEQVCATQTISPKDFHVQLNSIDKLVQLSMDIESYIKDSNRTVNDDEVQVGSPCLACYSENDCWYRGLIVKAEDNNTFQVTFVDYGNEEIVPRGSVKKLPSEFSKFPVQALHCFLAGIVPINEQWSEEALIFFSDYMKNVILNAKILCISDGHYGVSLIKKGDTKSINSQLVDLGFAKVEMGCRFDVENRNCHFDNQEQHDYQDTEKICSGQDYSDVYIPSLEDKGCSAAGLKTDLWRTKDVNSQ